MRVDGRIARSAAEPGGVTCLVHRSRKQRTSGTGTETQTQRHDGYGSQLASGQAISSRQPKINQKHGSGLVRSETNGIVGRFDVAMQKSSLVNLLNPPQHLTCKTRTRSNTKLLLWSSSSQL
jgi:hypothetical protein